MEQKSTQGAKSITTGIIYAIQIYVGHMGDPMSERWTKYEVMNRPTQNELTTHCHKDHDLEKDLEVFILDHSIPSHL